MNFDECYENTQNTKRHRTIPSQRRVGSVCMRLQPGRFSAHCYNSLLRQILHTQAFTSLADEHAPSDLNVN
jgi:hypothetical protein